ncbi:MAG: hypothetical protein HYV51_03625 [Parcubacteria group bacterium]|nr:hypothetical protein [Parcubacteria group bacterium]
MEHRDGKSVEINLQKVSGLPISFGEKKMTLEFHGDFPFIQESKRTLEELKPYLKNPDVKNCLPALPTGQAGGRQGPNPVYHVWRNVHLASDNEKITSHNLRYDLTLLPPGIICPVRSKTPTASDDLSTSNGVDCEFVKTAGHYHKKPYPEVYEVLVGRAYFLIQSKSAAYLTEAGPGEKFVIPPSFGHNTINVFNEPLLIANFVSEKAEYNYEPYKNNHGAMYYFVSGGELVNIEKNPNYNSVPEIQKIRAREYPEFGLVKSQPLYSLINNIEKLRFLNYPEEFRGEWRNW